MNENAVLTKRDGQKVNVILIVLELAQGGELFDIIAGTGSFTEPITRYYFQQVVSALHNLHNKGLAHRDLKPENLLMDINYQIKLADFGFSASLMGRDGSGKM